MYVPEPELREWLDSIVDLELQRLVAEAFVIAADVQLTDETEDVFTPFVYPH